MPIGSYRSFKGTCCLHLQGTSTNSLDLEDEGSKALWNVADFFINLNGIILQKSEVFIDTAVRTSTIVNITGWWLDWSCLLAGRVEGVVGRWMWYGWNRNNWDMIVQCREAERQISVRKTDLLKKERRFVIGKSLNNHKGLWCLMGLIRLWRLIREALCEVHSSQEQRIMRSDGASPWACVEFWSLHFTSWCSHGITAECV